MADPIPAACPFDAYPSPILQKGTHANDGTPTFTVICPVCRIHTPELASMQAAVDAWGARAAVPTATYVTWLAAFATWKAANPPVPDAAPSYTTWLASAATEAGVAADVAEFEAWIVAHPPTANLAPTYVTWEAALAAWIVAHPPVAD
jgi:hypothetical protein